MDTGTVGDTGEGGGGGFMGGEGVGPMFIQTHVKSITVKIIKTG